MATFKDCNTSAPPDHTSQPAFDSVNKQLHVGDLFVKRFDEHGTDEELFPVTVSDTNHCICVGKSLMNMRETREFVDAMLIVENTEQTVAAHKCILAANSPIIYERIKSKETEHKHIDTPIEISIETNSVDALDKIISFMYTGQLRLNLEIVEDILNLDKLLEITGVNVLCLEYLSNCINGSNWMWMNIIAEKYNFTECFKTKLYQYASENLEDIIKDNDIIHLDHSSILSLLQECQSADNTGTELAKMELILKWIGYNDDRLVYFEKFLTFLQKNLLNEPNIKTICQPYSSILSKLDANLWHSFIEEVAAVQQNDIRKSKKSKPVMKGRQTKCENVFEVRNNETVSSKTNIGNEANQLVPKLKFESGCTDIYAQSDDITPMIAYEKSQDILCDATKPKQGNHTFKAKQKVSYTTDKPRRNASKMKRLKMNTNLTQDDTYDILDEYQENEVDESIIQKGTETKKTDVAKNIIAEMRNTLEGSDGKMDIPASENVLPETNKKVKNFRREKKIGYKSKVEDHYSFLPEKIKRTRSKKATSEAEMFVCEKCQRKFSTPSALKHHMKGHGAKQPFLCEVCGFKTIHFASMNVHKRKHNDQLRFHCSWPGCGYTAIRRSRLDDHYSAHQGIKNHVCSVCGKAFAGRKHLHRHEQLHKGEKLRCAECPYESPRRDKLRDHIKKHHPATAVLHGFITKEECDKPPAESKPRKPKVPRSKKNLKKDKTVGNNLELNETIIPVLQAVPTQFKQEVCKEDQDAVATLDEVHNPVIAVTASITGGQPGYITLPPHMFTSAGMTTEEVIQYISMTMGGGASAVPTVIHPPPENISAPAAITVTQPSSICYTVSTKSTVAAPSAVSTSIPVNNIQEQQQSTTNVTSAEHGNETQYWYQVQ